jgi:IS5 family transposase
MKTMSTETGRLGVSPQTVIGAMIIKHKLKLSDIETIETIKENPYMQFMLGLSEFQEEPVFDSSLFVTIRRRMSAELFDQFNQEIIKCADAKKDHGHNKRNKDEDGNPKNRGKLQMDATVADQEIKYPTDHDLLNDSRIISERVIDFLSDALSLEKKPRTYRRKARKDFLNLSKKRKKSKKDIRRCSKQQLQYLRRNFKTINKLLDRFDSLPLPAKLLKQYWVIQHVFAQQSYMHENNIHRCDDRIVNIHQPYVRPIVRGKQKSKVEFGAKLGLSLSNGFSRLDTISWDAYNESFDLKKSVKSYNKLHGHYPDLVQVDQIYATKENRAFLKSLGIRITAKPLGRPSKQKKEETAYQRRKRKTEFNERNHVEGKFGQAKRGYNMNNIRAKRLDTSKSWVSCIIFVLNLLRLKQIFMPCAQMSISSINMYSIWKMMVIKICGYEKRTKFAFSVFQ